MNRRELFPILAAGLAADLEAQHIHGEGVPVVATDAYRLRCFTKAEHRLLDRLAEWILPADEHSGGAHDARVANYIDLVTSFASEAGQKRWRQGLAEIDAASRERFGKVFLDCPAKEQEDLLTTISADEEDPHSDLGRFFVLVKNATIDGYRMSPVGMSQWMGWKGHPGGLYPGCDHPGEH